MLSELFTKINALKFKYFFLLSIAFAISYEAFAENTNVAVAANFYAPLKNIAADFEKETGLKVRLVSGASGKIFAQIRNGAPFDVFLSADQTKPLALEKAGLGVADSRFTYAQGMLVLWSSQPDLAVSDGEILRSKSFHRLAIANPKLAPYGAAAKDVLRRLKLYDSVKAKLVYGENIAQTFQFVVSGNAQLGFIALSQVIQLSRSGRFDFNSGSLWKVPSHLHAPIYQDAIVLQRAKNNPTAKAFVQFLRSKQAETIIRSYGYQVMMESATFSNANFNMTDSNNINMGLDD